MIAAVGTGWSFLVNGVSFAVLASLSCFASELYHRRAAHPHRY